MSVRFTQLQCKEVICISDGRRLGFISDVVVEVPDGRLCAIVVPGPGRLLGVLGRHEDFFLALISSRFRLWVKIDSVQQICGKKPVKQSSAPVAKPASRRQF